jgi:hypothetical protein
LAQGRLRTKEAAICEERRGATVSWGRRRRARCAPRTDLFGRPFVLARRWAGLMQRRIEMLALHVADNPINGAIAALWHGRPGARQLPSESRRDPAPPTAARRPARCPSRCRSPIYPCEGGWRYPSFQQGGQLGDAEPIMVAKCGNGRRVLTCASEGKAHHPI